MTIERQDRDALESQIGSKKEEKIPWKYILNRKFN